MANRLNTDELAYLLVRLFNKDPSSSQRDAFFVDFLISLFEDDREAQNSGDRKDGESRYELSPFNTLYSNFFRDKVMPLLKTKSRDEE